ncbi:hypothetical protein ONZ45_g13493 [Pleurotus djamor]|nr:hypothetical protein ONZ45_g13493 [Pleurotus djamor]
MLTFYINFVNDLNPGPTWPRYTTRGREVLQLMRDNITVIPDDWDKDKTDFINSARVLAQFQNYVVNIAVSRSDSPSAASDPATNPDRILQFSVDMGKPIIFVSLNYRMNTFGFLASASMDPRDLNAGLQDQRLALQFLQENINAFGGDPAKTLLGLNNAMVAGTLNGQLWEPTVHPANFINQRPSDKILSGKFLHVPYLGGTNLNEGTFFSGTVRSLNLSGEAEVSAFNDFIFHLLVDNTTVTKDVMDEFRMLFPANDPSLGAPFNTGDSLFDRAVAWYTDEMFLGPRRFFFEKAASLQPMFAYHFKEFIPGNDPARGVSHATELPLLFGPVPTSIETTFADQFLSFYINFVHDTNPGPTWPRYASRERKVLQLLRGNITVTPDGLATGWYHTERQTPRFSLDPWRFIRNWVRSRIVRHTLPKQRLPTGLLQVHLSIQRVRSLFSAPYLPVECPDSTLGILQRSVSIGKPILFASINYRLNTFGFLASSSMDSKDLNAGLLDQRVALDFLQDNLAAFGGDPRKVTIWGQSAGAGSVQTHLLFPPVRSTFRAVIANSATGPIKSAPPPSTYDKPGEPFSRLLATTGCPSGRGAVACLQKIPFREFLNISNGMVSSTLNDQLWEPTFDPGSFLNQRPSQRVLSGQFLHIPYLGGTNINEGKTFTMSVQNLHLSGAAEVASFDNLIDHLMIDNSTLTQDVLDGFHTLFPANDTSLGAPFNTGDSLYDRAEAWYTVQNFVGPRRLFFASGSPRQPMFAYHFREFIPGNDPTLGVFHGSELSLLFGPVPTPVELDFANQMLDFYINFINDLNPGACFDL